MERKTMVLGGASVVSFIIGAVSGYFYAKNKLETNLEEKYDLFSRQSVAEAKKFYSALYKREAFTTPDSTASAFQREEDHSISDEELGIFNGAVNALTSYQGTALPIVPLRATPHEVEPPTRVIESRNVFEEHDMPLPEWSYEEEIRERNTELAYVISKEEFFENETTYNQVTFTYYGKDEILTDEKEEPFTINDADNVANLSENVNKFGWFSGDRRVVYLRNEKLGLEIEMLKSDGSYSQEVLGFTPSQFRDRPRPNKASPSNSPIPTRFSGTGGDDE